MLRIGQIRAAQRAAYFQPVARRRVFIFDSADTMRWEVQNVLLKILEEPPGSATLILTAPSPYSLLPTILSRCMQFTSRRSRISEVERILREKSDKSPAQSPSGGAQLSKAARGSRWKWTFETASKRRQSALRILERAAKGQGFAQLFWPRAAASKESSRSFARAEVSAKSCAKPWPFAGAFQDAQCGLPAFACRFDVHFQREPRAAFGKLRRLTGLRGRFVRLSLRMRFHFRNREAARSEIACSARGLSAARNKVKALSVLV